MENKIVNKIKKLLSLAGSSNQNEAETASKKANELLIKHNLKMQDVKSHSSDYEREILSAKTKQSPEDKYINGILSKHFFVQLVIARDKRNNITTVYILGRKENVEVAGYVKDFLTRAFRDLWAKYRNESKCPANFKQSYFIGLYKGLDEQLSVTRKATEAETGLIVIKQDEALSEFINDIFGKLKNSRKHTISTRDSRAIEAGKEAGKSLKIQQGISNNSGQSGLYLK